MEKKSEIGILKILKEESENVINLDSKSVLIFLFFKAFMSFAAENTGKGRLFQSLPVERIIE